MAETIRTRLRTAPAAGELETAVDLTVVDVIVYQQRKIAAEVDAAVAKSAGCAIVIMWEGWRTLNANAGRPRLAHRYNICVWSKPVFDSAAEYPADQVMESIIARLWQWVPGGGHAHGEAQPEDGGIVPDKTWLKIDCSVTIPIYH